jgi:hypothetical protein
MAQITISYKRYNHFSEVPARHLPILKRLTRGKYGIMASLVQAYQQGYVWDTYEDNQSWTYMPEWDSMQRSLFIAYVRQMPVGWCITDDEGLLNVFVRRDMRKLGIAQNLAYLWSTENIPKVKKLLNGAIYEIVHTEDAEMLVRAAAIRLGITKRTRRKYQKVIHNLGLENN